MWPFQKEMQNRSIPSKDTEDELEHNAATITKLRKQVGYLLQRNAQMSTEHASCLHTKISQHVSHRSLQMVEAVIHKDMLGRPCPWVTAVDVPVKTSSDLIEFDVTNPIKIGKDGSSVFCGQWYTGESVILKRHEDFAVASYEFSVLQGLGKMKVTDTPKVICLLYIFNEIFLVMKNVYSSVPHHCSMAQVRPGRFSTSQLLSILNQCSHLLLNIHSASVLHNNITIDNIGILLEGDAVLSTTFFGFSKACHATRAALLNNRQVHSGCFSHLPPSVASGAQPVSFASDVYSFGQVILQLVHRFKGVTSNDSILNKIEMFGLKLVRHNFASTPTGLLFAETIKNHLE